MIHSDSDISAAMIASQTFDEILQMIQKSNLNFVLQVSPFSANISLKKSLVTIPDQVSTEVLTAVQTKNVELENALLNIGSELVSATDNCESAHARIKLLEEEKDSAINTIEILEQKIAKAESNFLKLFEEKKPKIEAFKRQIKPLNVEMHNSTSAHSIPAHAVHVH